MKFLESLGEEFRITVCGWKQYFWQRRVVANWILATNYFPLHITGIRIILPLVMCLVWRSWKKSASGCLFDLGIGSTTFFSHIPSTGRALQSVFSKKKTSEPSRAAADPPSLITLTQNKYLFESHWDNICAISHCCLLFQITEAETVNAIKMSAMELN